MSRRWAALLGVLVATAGCAVATTGTAVPAEPPGPALPLRPREVRLDGLNPCEGLTEPQQAQLDVFRPRFEPDDGETGVTCQWRHGPGEPIEGYILIYDLRNDVTAAFTNPRTGPVFTVAGFPALETQGGLAPEDLTCIVVVGVARGQALAVQYSYQGYQLPMTRELACEKAGVAADLAMQTLLATR